MKTYFNILIYINLSFSPVFDEDVSAVWNYDNSVDQYSAYGGTAKSSVMDQIKNLQHWISAL